MQGSANYVFGEDAQPVWRLERLETEGLSARMTGAQGEPELGLGPRKSTSELAPRHRRSENWGSGNWAQGRRAGKGWRTGVQVSGGWFEVMVKESGD